ncbi:MAG: hypothetical protein KAR42_07785 [candidate division Zixibacteria bacterium]|nr:hypothetical protein [candidate division Zixibacteria bacterium]
MSQKLVSKTRISEKVCLPIIVIIFSIFIYIHLPGIIREGRTIGIIIHIIIAIFIIYTSFSTFRLQVIMTQDYIEYRNIWTVRIYYDDISTIKVGKEMTIVSSQGKIKINKRLNKRKEIMKYILFNIAKKYDIPIVGDLENMLIDYWIDTSNDS